MLVSDDVQVVNNPVWHEFHVIRKVKSTPLTTFRPWLSMRSMSLSAPGLLWMPPSNKGRDTARRVGRTNQEMI